MAPTYLIVLILSQVIAHVTANVDLNVKYIDPNHKFGLYWNILTTSDCNKFGITVDCIEIGLHVESNGWIGFGISNNGQMTESDIIIGWIDNHKTYLQSRYTLNKRVTPIFAKDISNTITSSQKIGNITHISFIREIFACDSDTTTKHEYIKRSIEIGTTTIIYAWNDNIPNCGQSEACDIEFHGAINRGKKRINFFSAKSFTEMPKDTQFYDLVNDNYAIPTVGTTYYHKFMMFNIENINKPRHIIQIAPVIQKGNEIYVHHVVIEKCPKFNAQHLGISGISGTRALVNDGGKLKKQGTICNKVMMEWAIGRNEFYLPKHVGLELGGTADDRLEYVRVTWHYNNPEKIPNLMDSSGLRFYYTNMLRESTAMIMSVQHPTYPIFIPGGIEQSITYGHCPSQCTKDAYMNTTGINIISVAFHMHLTGFAGKLRHSRNGTELEPINENRAYDTTYQEFILLKKERNILPGDDLILECHYNTSDRILPTFGGKSGFDEMCIAWMIVYPKNDVDNCMSRPADNMVKAFYSDAAAKGYWHEKKRRRRVIREKSYYNTTNKQAVQLYKDFQIQPHRLGYCGGNVIEFITPESKHDFIAYQEKTYSDMCKVHNDSMSVNVNEFVSLRLGEYKLNNNELSGIISVVIVVLILLLVCALFALVRGKSENMEKYQLSHEGVHESEREFFLSSISHDL